MPARDGGEPRILVATVDERLSLFELADSGRLEAARVGNERRQTGACRTRRHGTFAAALPPGLSFMVKAPRPRAATIVDRSRLVWIDPGRAGLAWEYTPRAARRSSACRAGVEGSLLVVVDQSGRYMALNPANGRPLSDGYSLDGGMAPLAARSPSMRGADSSHH